MVRYWMSDITTNGIKFKTVEKKLLINVFDFSVTLVGWRIRGQKKNEHIVL